MSQQFAHRFWRSWQRRTLMRDLSDDEMILPWRLQQVARRLREQTLLGA
jgi:hypothetical protein